MFPQGLLEVLPVEWKMSLKHLEFLAIAGSEVKVTYFLENQGRINWWLRE